jgi:DNA-binding NarL/FixJ family response regulator
MAPATRVLALSMHDETAFVLAMLEAGASGYLLKNDPLPEILAGVQAAAQGAPVLSSALVPALRAVLPADAGWPRAETLSANFRRAIGTPPMGRGDPAA